MKKGLLVGIPTALFVGAIWVIVQGIDPMVKQENNNKFHAILLDCKYLGKSDNNMNILYFDCNDKIEIHKEIKW